MARKHKHPIIKRVHVYETRDAAERERDAQAKSHFGVDIIVQSVGVDAEGRSKGYIVRHLQMTETKAANNASLPKTVVPKFTDAADRLAYMEAVRAVQGYAEAEAATIVLPRSREPKSIYAEVPSRSMAKPKIKSKRKEHEDSSYARSGRYTPAEIARGWHKIPRTS